MAQWKPNHVEFEYSLVNGASQLLYLGIADMWVSEADAQWTVKKFNWGVVADGTTQLLAVETLGDVKWSDRATLPWV